MAEVSKDLVRLRWFHSEQRNLSSLYLFKNLRVLELYEDENSREGHYLEELWNADDDAPPQLRVLVISGCTEFQRFPKSIGSFKHLKKILVGNKYNSNKLKSLPEEFGRLQLLEHLELSNCNELRMLPDNFGNLRNLRYLDLSRCKKLRKLPESFKELTLLQHLQLEGCWNLTLEPDIFIRITKLEYLNLSECSVEELPYHITNQVSLAELHLWDLHRLRELPINIGQLSKLRVLNIRSECEQLTSLPTSLGDLSSLTKLDIACYELKSLPPTLGDLSSLNELFIGSCELKELFIGSCELKCLPLTLGSLSSSSKLQISCSKLEYLPSNLRGLGKLIDLKIEGCSQLECLPDSLGCLNLLENLELYSSGVKSLPKSIVQLTSLQKLHIEDCPIGELNLAVRLFTSSLYNLKEISLVDVRVTKLSISEECCPSLETLRFRFDSHVTEIEVLPISVCDLLLYNCSKLRNIRAICGLVNIKTLRILQCPMLDVLPLSLQIFELYGCDKVKEIQGLQLRRSLEMLKVNSALEVSGIDCFEFMERLRRVHLRAMSRSSAEGCIQSMQKLPEESHP